MTPRGGSRWFPGLCLRDWSRGVAWFTQLGRVVLVTVSSYRASRSVAFCCVEVERSCATWHRAAVPVSASPACPDRVFLSRFIVGSDRAIFMLRDGSYAWEIKDFLVSQDRCADVTLEGQVYPGRGGGGEKNKTKQEKGKKRKEGEPKSRAAEAAKEDNRAGSKRAEL